MLYGQNNQRKDALSKKLYNLISDESRNWRRSVFIFTNDDFDVYSSDDEIYKFLKVLSSTGVDIVANIEFKTDKILTKFLKNFGDLVTLINIQDTPKPNTKCISHCYLDISKYKINRQFSKLVNTLKELERI